MSREVRHDGDTLELQVRFSFDRSLVDRIKSLPRRRWHASERYWSVPQDYVVPLVDLLRDDGFQFDDGTRELYRTMGGLATLDEGPPSAERPAQRGLFDEPAPATSSAAADDWTVSGLNEKVRDLIEGAFPQSVWLVGEISGFNKSAHRRIVGFQLIETGEDGRKLSELSATLFDDARQQIEAELARAGDPFRLEDELTVRLRVRVSLYVPWGSYRVIVEGIDVGYTLGEAARRREEIVRRLTEAGLADRNPSLPIPDLPLRLGLITSLGSDAYNDVLRTLEESGLAFRVTAHGARVQGHQTESSVLNALDWFRDRTDELDVVLICRGGGSRTDLAWFDSEALGRAVAGFPLPIIVGIGHEQDHSVLDAVARRAKTPTAAAGFVVQVVRDSLERLEGAGRQIFEAAAGAIDGERRIERERERRLARATRNLFERERVVLGHRRQRLSLAARGRIASARDSLRHWIRALPRASAVCLERRRAYLEGAVRGLIQAARRDQTAAVGHLERLRDRLGPASRRRLAVEHERLEAREQRMRILDPRRVVERGYAILRGGDGRVITGPDAAPAGTAVRAELRDGSLALRSEGTDDAGTDT